MDTPRMKSSAKKRPSFVRRILSRRQRGRFVCPAVNPRIKELIPFGQPKGCERFRVRIISRPGRRRDGETEGGGGAKRERERNRQEGEDEGRGLGMTWRKAREEERDSPGERERKRSCVCVRESEKEREKTRLDVRSAGNKDNSMQ